MTKVKKIIFSALVLALLVGIFIGGAFFGYANRPEIEKVRILFNKESAKPAEIDFSPFWKAWNTIESKYASNDGRNSQEMVWGAIKGLVGSLDDPYSVFFPPQEAKQFQEDMQGDFGGVGMEIGIRKGVLTVISPLKDTPAERAGIKAGDKILKIDDEITSDMSVEQAVRLIRGEKGTSVKLTIFHKDAEKPVEITIIRDIIQIPVLDTEKKPEGIFIIKMYNFSGNSTNIFRNTLREFIFSGSDKLILDLRNNPGGYLESAVDIASWFLPVGKIVAREKFSSGEEKVFRSKGYDIFDSPAGELPMVVLVNEGSASASEILAGALQEHGVAKLVGIKTFGKGSVQELIEITPDTSLKLTIARWLTPNGKSISEQGLEPDIKIEITDKDIEANRDPQMEKAIEILRNQ
ncbi:MAG: S41 family peptidase [Candidatus Terrybacteria bacterium]|nr:S41 family peptidase [Candidatus Terrybacteria bacterium]